MFEIIKSRSLVLNNENRKPNLLLLNLLPSFFPLKCANQKVS